MIVEVPYDFDTIPTAALPPNPEKDGYAFIGWNTKEDGSGDYLTTDTIITKGVNITYYPIWESSIVPFAVYSSDDNSLTFYNADILKVGDVYNNKTVTEVYRDFLDTRYDYIDDSPYSNTPWASISAFVSSVIFDSTFKEVKPKYIANWFENFSMMSTVNGIENLDTSEVVDMEGVFSDCTSITSLDLSTFDTSKVETLYVMFYNCSRLTTLNVSNWDVSNVTDMSYVFQDCKALTSLDVSNWITNKATTMKGVFFGCSSLSTIDVSRWDTSNTTNLSYFFDGCTNLTIEETSSFNTSKVTDMSYMFCKCSTITYIDVSSFNTSNVINMSHMFESAGKLVTIYSLEDGFDTSKVLSYDNMFTGCTSLVGGNGTTYNIANTTIEMAHIDTADNPGYFTSIHALPSFAIYSADDNSFTFYANMDHTTPAVGSIYNGKTVTNLYSDFQNDEFTGSESATSWTCTAPWSGIAQSVKTVKIDESYDLVRPKYCAYWFFHFDQCTEMDLTYLNTSEAVDINGMFRACFSITSLDMSHIYTNNVTSMAQMFYQCSNLTSIDVSRFNTSKTTAMNGMFRETNVETLDIRSFDTSNATAINAMFRDSPNLKTIYSYDFDTSSVTNSVNMFSGCTSLVGGNGTIYSSSKVDASMAHIDTEDNPGYFTKPT